MLHSRRRSLFRRRYTLLLTLLLLCLLLLHTKLLRRSHPRPQPHIHKARLPQRIHRRRLLLLLLCRTRLRGQLRRLSPRCPIHPTLHLHLHLPRLPLHRRHRLSRLYHPTRTTTRMLLRINSRTLRSPSLLRQMRHNMLLLRRLLLLKCLLRLLRPQMLHIQRLLLLLLILPHRMMRRLSIHQVRSRWMCHPRRPTRMRLMPLLLLLLTLTTASASLIARVPTGDP